MFRGDKRNVDFSEAKQRFSIKKFKFGAASVLIGLAFLGPFTQKVLAEEPVTTEPVSVDMVTNEPVTTEPVSVDMVTNEPVTTEPVSVDMVTNEPVTTEPVSVDMVTNEPVTTEPVSVEKVTNEPVTTEPVSVDPVVLERTSLDGANMLRATVDSGTSGLTDTSISPFDIENAIYVPGDSTKIQTYSGKAFIYESGDLSDNGNQQPVVGMEVYLQWVNGKGFVSPVFKTITDENGLYVFDLSQPITDELGNDYSFVLAGDSKFVIRTWAKNIDSEKYDVIQHGDKFYGYHNRIDRKNESWDFTAGVNKIVNGIIILQEKMMTEDWLSKTNDESQISPNPDGIWPDRGIYGTVRGNVWYEGSEGAGTLSDEYLFGGVGGSGDIAAQGLKVQASYVNDEVARRFDTWKTEHPGYTLEDFKAAQAQIISEYEQQFGTGSHIAETVIATVASDGSYYIPFRGLYGISRTNKGAKTSVDEYGTLVRDEDVKNDSLMQWNGTLGQRHRHINSDYLYVSPLIDGYSIWSDAFQQNLFQDARDTLTTVLASTNISSVDFAIMQPQARHDILVYDSLDNLAHPGNVAQSETTGLLPNTAYKIQWFQDGVTLGQPVDVVSDEQGRIIIQDGTSITVPLDLQQDTVYTSAVFLATQDTSDYNGAVAIDSFTAVIAIDPLTATATPVTVPEGQAVPADTKVVETNKSDAVISSTPTNGLSVDENGNLVGTPTVDDWGTEEETREVKVPVKVTNTLPDGTEEVVEVEVPVTVNRDTDGDGIIDSEDPDDDNDGVEDGSDETPKAFTDLTATATPVTVPEGQAVPADTKVVETNKSDAVISSTPTNGLSVD
ncbi:YSIRK-type signal peptide-containing protein, partial [Streptococcus uberis]